MQFCFVIIRSDYSKFDIFFPQHFTSSFAQNFTPILLSDHKSRKIKATLQATKWFSSSDGRGRVCVCG